MDEKKLQALFKDAVPDAPAPSFSLGDVRAESGAQSRRHRNLLLGGSALGIAILTGATVLGVALWRGTGTENANNAASAPGIDASSGNSGSRPSDLSDKDQTPRAASGGAEQQKSFPPESPKQGGTSNGNAGPQGPGSTLQGCGQADRELAAALAGELPAAASNDLLAATVICPYGSRAFAVQVNSDGRTGLVTVVLTPVDGKIDYPVTGSPQGTVVGTGTVKDGKRVYVITEPTGGSQTAPLDTQVQDIADHAAAKLSG